MQPVPTGDTNVRLRLPGLAPLPAEKCLIAQPGQPGATAEGYETTWVPTPEERRRIAGGAPIKLQLQTRMHPPTGMTVGEVPSGAVTIYDYEEIAMAMGALFSHLRNITHGENADPSLDPVITVDLGDEDVGYSLTRREWANVIDAALSAAAMRMAAQRARNGGDPANGEPHGDDDAPRKP